MINGLFELEHNLVRSFLRLKINLEKSVILPVGSVENAESLALKLGYRTEILPSTYLGLPLGAVQKWT